ncbi:MAG: rhomboid family intramembrane serine protease [Candidatus Aminicenantes bacterium]|nr:rhomboid family intramembrane serine protease [Candidatus Aminicenantes bacterium]
MPLKDENPTQRFSYVTVFLIALNIIIFLLQVFSSHGLEGSIIRMGAIPYELTHFRTLPYFSRISPPLTLLTCMFLHGGLLHLLFNMLYLWIFGNNVEDFLGPVRYILFYLVSGLGASLTHIIFNPSSRIPMIGASGAIAGVLGAYFLLFPRANILTFIFLFIFIRVVPIPAAVVLGIWFLMQLLNMGFGGGVAWFAHIGGFLVGLFLVKIYVRRKQRFSNQH